jgi:hypothetical protein
MAAVPRRISRASPHAETALTATETAVLRLGNRVTIPAIAEAR